MLVAAVEDSAAFGVFYRRYEGPMLAFFVRRTRDPELAADLTAEVFARALESCGRFRAGGAPATAWLFGIAQHTLAKSRRRGAVAHRARDRLGMALISLDSEDLAAATGPVLPSNPTSRQHRQENYLYDALTTVTRHDRACSLVSSALTQKATISQGSPSPTLLSILGVLRRPAHATDRLPVRITYHPYRRDPTGSLPPLKGVYVRYIRRAAWRYGAGYYVIPAADANALRPIPDRCYAQMHAAVDHELDRVPAALHAGTLKLEPRFVDQLRARTTPAPGVCLAALNDTGNGDGCGGGYTVTDIEQGHTISTGGPSGVGVVYGIAPDGVSAVTLRYPRRSFTVAVINNVFILKDPGQHLPNFGFPNTIIWRATNNTTIKTINDR